MTRKTYDIGKNLIEKLQEYLDERDIHTNRELETAILQLLEQVRKEKAGLSPPHI